MIAYAKVAVALALIGVGFLAGAGWQKGNVAAAKLELAQYKTGQAELWRQQAELTSKVKDSLHTWRQAQAVQVAELDAQHEKERADANREYERRIDAVRAGTVRVRYVAATCPDRAVPAAPGATGLDDEPGIGLTAEAGQDVLLLRRAIERDQEVIEGLREYIRKVLLKEPG